MSELFSRLVLKDINTISSPMHYLFNNPHPFVHFYNTGKPPIKWDHLHDMGQHIKMVQVIGAVKVVKQMTCRMLGYMNWAKGVPNSAN